MPLRPPAGFIRPGFDPLKNPNAPTIGTATAGNAQLSVTFTAPSNVGGSAITSYLAAARKTSDGTLTNASGAASPTVVTGLTNGDAYTATVVASNSYGSSVPSAASTSATPSSSPPIGSAFGGGFFAGQISTTGNGVADYNLVIGPKATAQTLTIIKYESSATAGTSSYINGPANTNAMTPLSSYPAAQFCKGLTVGGFSDWYLPAQNEFEICYYNLKPTTENNSTSSPALGGNNNSVPKRTTTYTDGIPAQTSASAFKVGGSEALTYYYWSSTQFDYAYSGMFQWTTGVYTGSENPITQKYAAYNVRAVRRVPV